MTYQAELGSGGVAFASRILRGADVAGHKFRLMDCLNFVIGVASLFVFLRHKVSQHILSSVPPCGFSPFSICPHAWGDQQRQDVCRQVLECQCSLLVSACLLVRISVIA